MMLPPCPFATSTPIPTPSHVLLVCSPLFLAVCRSCYPTKTISVSFGNYFTVFICTLSRCILSLFLGVVLACTVARLRVPTAIHGRRCCWHVSVGLRILGLATGFPG